MKIRTIKRMLYFLKDLENTIVTPGSLNVSKELIKHFTDSELREMIFWLHKDSWSKNALGFLPRQELIDLISGDCEILRWTIYDLESKITNFPNYSQKEIDHYFEKTQNQIHYLASKPAQNWDAYDISNYRSLMIKTGTSKKVYGIFTSDVLAEDVYAVTTKPSYFFDTKEEAQAEIDNIIKQENFKRDELIIHSLWIIQNQE